MSKNNKSWEKIFKDKNIFKHNFDESPFEISAQEIKTACQDFTKTSQKEVRILCKQDKRDDRPEIFIKKNLFILPIKNGIYSIIKGEGYTDIPDIEQKESTYTSKVKFTLDSSKVGDSEMQHLDYAYATSLIRTFLEDPTLILTIRGRKYTPEFNFYVGKHTIHVSKVQTEVDAGYEGKNQIVLIEAKNNNSKNVLIRQLYYPYRQWQQCTNKKVTTLFFDKTQKTNIFKIWQFEFSDQMNYNSIKLVKSGKFIIQSSNN